MVTKNAVFMRSVAFRKRLENFINVGMRKIFCAPQIIFRYTMKHTLMQNPRVFWRTLPVSKILWMISFRSV